MKKLICLFVFLAGFSIIQAQNKVDSLVNELNTQKHMPEEEIKLYMDITKSYLFNDPETSVRYAKEGLVVAAKEKNYSALAQFNEFIGLGYHYRWDDSVDVSINHFNKALEFAAKCENRDLREARIYINMGVVYSGHDDQHSALECYLKALPHAEAIDNKGFQAMILCNIGGAHRTLRNITQAKEYIERGLSIAEENDFKDSQATGYYNLGDIYRYNEEYDKAEEYLLKAYDLTMWSNDIYLRSLVLSCLTLVYANTGQYEKSLERANESVELAKEGGNAGYIAATYRTLSDAYYRMKLYKECEDAALKGWAADSTNLDQSHALAFNIGLANIFLDNKLKAAHYFWRHSELMNEHIDKSFRQEIVNNEVKYETEKKEMRIASLEKEKTLYIWLSIAGAAILLLAFGLLFFRHRSNIQKRKLAEQQVKQLEQENQLIATQAILDGETAERSRLARDLHDGLGGMLSVVKLNLKDMKGFSIIDGPDMTRFDKAIKMLDESIDELRRVAHHMMPESLMRYGLKVSLEDFCRAIPGAHFQYLGGDPRLDSRLEVLIYRCTYELVNNAVKHADATTINIQLMVDNGVVSLTVQDNGIGFDPKTVSLGAGLENIRTRVSAYNGKMNIYSSPGKGTEVSIEIEQV